MSIGRSSVHSREKSQSTELDEYLEASIPIVNCPDLKLPSPTFGKSSPELWTPNSNSDRNRLELMRLPIGRLFGKVQRGEISPLFPHELGWYLIAPSERLLPLMTALLESNEAAWSIGAPQGQESQDELGMKQVWMLIVKIQEANFGAAIKLNNLLSSMNFEAVSTFPTFSGGPTGTLCVLKSRGRAYLSLLVEFGLLLTSIPDYGIPM